MTTTPLAPTVTDRPGQPYVGIRRRVTMQSMAEIVDRTPELFGWLDGRGIEPTGAPFLKYDLIDMAGVLEVEAGVPVASTVDGEGDVFAGTLPAGRYVTLVHHGHPDELERVTGDLLAWAAGLGLDWDMTQTPTGERWGCRLESYETDPREQPDMHRWDTELAFRLRD